MMIMTAGGGGEHYLGSDKVAVLEALLLAFPALGQSILTVINNYNYYSTTFYLFLHFP